MVATLLRLRLDLLRGTLRRDRWRLVLLVLGGVWVLGMIPNLALAGLWLRAQPAQTSTDVLVVLGTMLLVGWVLVPVLLFGVDDALDPRHFWLFGVSMRRVVPGLVVAACVSVPALFALLVAAMIVLGWSDAGVGASVLAVCSVPVVVVTCVLAARLSTAAAALALATRSGRRWAALGGGLALVGGVRLAVGIAQTGLEESLEKVPGLVEILAWTPLGAVWAAPGTAGAGDVLGGVLQLCVAVVYCVLAAVAWGVVVSRLVERPAQVNRVRAYERDAVLVAGGRVTGRRRRAERLATAAVAARSRRSWGRDPRYLTALVSAGVLGLVSAAAAEWGGLLPGVEHAGPVVAVPLLAGLLAWGRHNDAGFDGSAFWMHVVAPMGGGADRVGRVRAVAGWLVPTIVVGAALAGAVNGDGEIAVGVLGLAIGVAGAGLGAASLLGGLLPYPVQASGESPFAAGMGSVLSSTLAQLAASVLTWVAVLPLLVVAWAWLVDLRVGALHVLGVGLVTGLVAGAAGVVAGGDVLGRRWVLVLGRVR